MPDTRYIWWGRLGGEAASINIDGDKVTIICDVVGGASTYGIDIAGDTVTAICDVDGGASTYGITIAGDTVTAICDIDPGMDIFGVIEITGDTVTAICDVEAGAFSGYCKNNPLYVSNGAGYTGVGLVQAVNCAMNTVRSVDTTPLCAEYTAHRATQLSVSISAAGFFDYYGDVQGQRLIMDNAVNGATLLSKLILDPTTLSYIGMPLIVTDFTIKTTPHSMVEFNFTADSNGAPTYGVVVV